MPGNPFKRKPSVIDHWYVLLPDFEMSTQEFYKEIEAELTARKIPGLEFGRVEYFEGSVLSDRREYLRIGRERLLFDVCSAPFGTSWFFSCRFAQIPLRFTLWSALMLLAGLTGIFQLYVFGFGLQWGSIVFVTSIVGAIYLLNGVIPMGLYELDGRLVRIPVIGPFYEIFIRKNTYFRQDTRLMYCDLVDAVVRSKLEEFTAAKDVTNVEVKRDESDSGLGTFEIVGKLFRWIWGALRKI